MEDEEESGTGTLQDGEEEVLETEGTAEEGSEASKETESTGDTELDELLKEEKLTLGEKKRFTTVYGKMKTFERETTALRSQVSEQDAILNAVIEQNKVLIESLKGLQGGVHTNKLQSIESEITATRDAMLKAIEAGDTEKQFELMDKLSDLKSKKETTKPDEMKDVGDITAAKAEAYNRRSTEAKDAFVNDPRNADIITDPDAFMITKAIAAEFAKDPKYLSLPFAVFWGDVATKARLLSGKTKKGNAPNLGKSSYAGGKGDVDAGVGLTAIQKTWALKSFPELSKEEAYKEFKQGLEDIAKMERGGR